MFEYQLNQELLNVDVNALKSALTACRNSLHYDSSIAAINELINTGNIWQCDSKSKVGNALNKLVNEYYKDIENTLDNYQTVADKIAQYQNLRNEWLEVGSNYDDLQKRSKEIVEVTEEVWNNEKQTYETVTTTEVKQNPEIVRQLKQKSYRIKDIKEDMLTLQSEINNSI